MGVESMSRDAQNLIGSGLQMTAIADNLTALAGGGQTGATVLTGQVNRVTTVATSGDSVQLFPAGIGANIWVINAGANPMQVFANGAGTINGVAAATGVPQMPNSLCEYCQIALGVWFCQDLGQGFASGFMTVSTVDGLTAHAGGGQGSATLCTAMINRFTTVATIADSGLLPPSARGMNLTVINAATNSMNLFPSGTEQINALGASTAFALAGGKTAELYCATAGQWHAILSA